MVTAPGSARRRGNRTRLTGSLWGPVFEHALEEEEIDRAAVVEAGAVLQTVQETLAAEGLYFPLDLGARGSCTIGGNIATNAGGINVLRYGMMRNLVLGLETVLADGTVVSSLNRMLKNNAGYDTKQLFIGSEGSLGIVTRAVLRLFPQPASRQNAFVAFDSFDHVVRMLSFVQKELAGTLSAFEVMWNDYYHEVTGDGWHRPPLSRDYPFYGNVRPLLNEVLHAVDRLLESGEPTTIDLATLPFGPGELEHLEATLGSGELCATLDSLGTSHIRETAYPGVWWLEHRNAADEVVGRFLEHTRIFSFANGGHPEVYLSSADWMPRNFYRRVETMFPVVDEGLKRRVIDEILGLLGILGQVVDHLRSRVQTPLDVGGLEEERIGGEHFLRDLPEWADPREDPERPPMGSDDEGRLLRDLRCLPEGASARTFAHRDRCREMTLLVSIGLLMILTIFTTPWIRLRPKP